MSQHTGIRTEKLDVIACFNCASELDVSEYTLFERILCPACETELAVPGRLGHFVLLDALGAGAMGMVYLAVDEHLDREVALKVMREEFSADENALQMLQQEAQAAAALNHPNVVQVYEFGQSMNQPFIVMELVNHGRLDLEMADGQIVDEGFLLIAARGMSEGLAAAQAAGLTHGDIKPANILFDKKGVAKVVDFGLARFGGGQPGEVWGTPYYIAPEKAKGKSEDWRSDQYSLGATLWHGLAGYPPFDGETPTDVVVARLNNPVPSLVEANPLVTKETAAFIERMMNPSPGRRYPTYKSALADIDAAMAANKVATEARNAEATASNKSAGPKKKNYLAQIMISVVVIVGSLVGILQYQKSQEEKRRQNAAVLNPAPRTQAAPATRTDVEPLLGYDKRKLAEVVGKYKDGSSFGAQSTLMKLVEKQPEAAPSRSWIKLLNVVMIGLNGELDTVTDELESIIKAKVKYEGDTPPAENPVPLAKFLRGEIDANKLQSDTITTEKWYQVLRDLVISAKHIDDGKKEPAKIGLKNYLNATEGPDWIYLLKPFVQQKFDDISA